MSVSSTNANRAKQLWGFIDVIYWIPSLPSTIAFRGYSLQVLPQKNETRSISPERVSFALAEYFYSARKLLIKSALILATSSPIQVWSVYR